ncbi:hypothetical protein Tco_0064760 [Tanacetum coccineum]
MLAIDGVGFDLSYMADEEVPTNFALMDFLDSERNKPDLDSMSFDDLYNNFKIIEQEFKRTVTSSSNLGSQNMAFVSTPSSTNEVNTAKVNSVNTANGNRVTSDVREQGINVVKQTKVSLELKGYLINNRYADLEKMLYGWIGGYALTANPTIYVSLIEQFWKTITVNTVNDREQQLTITVDGQTIVITEAFVRRHLQLADADGISSLPNTEIFDQLTLMGYVSNDDKLTFQKVPITKPITDSFTTSHPTQTPSPMPYDSPLSGGHTHGSDEGIKKLNELTELCTKLFDKVTILKDDLKQTKKIYGKALTKLVKKFTPTKVTQGKEQCQESSKAQLSVLNAAKILADASKEKVKTYTRRRSTDSSRDNTAGGLFSTAEEVQGKEQISTDEKVAQKLNDKEMAREEQERVDFEKALELQKQLDEREETNNID